jgi:two-component system invasion response regulator UvrY
MRILIADDHLAVRCGLRALIETCKDWQVCAEAIDGDDAVQLTKTLRPDVVVLDISMPKLNGFAAARVIKELYPDTRILVYSIHHSDAFVKEAQRIGIEGYVTKAEDPAIFLTAVASVERNRPFFTPCLQLAANSVIPANKSG